KGVVGEEVQPRTFADLGLLLGEQPHVPGQRVAERLRRLRLGFLVGCGGVGGEAELGELTPALRGVVAPCFRRGRWAAGEGAFILVRADQHVYRVLSAVLEGDRQVLGYDLPVDDHAVAAQLLLHFLGRKRAQLGQRGRADLTGIGETAQLGRRRHVAEPARATWRWSRGRGVG